MRHCCALLLVAMLAGCARGPDGVVDKVLQDFGIRDRPEGYETGSDKVFSQLNNLGRTELQRLNNAKRHGEVKFEESNDLFGKFYKEVKVYEDFHPIDARSTGRASGDDDRGYIGLIEYNYRVYQSLRKNTRAEAAVEPATIATDIEGRETYRYEFDRAGSLKSGEGELVR